MCFFCGAPHFWAVISPFRSLSWEVERRVLVSDVHCWQVSQTKPFPHQVFSLQFSHLVLHSARPSVGFHVMWRRRHRNSDCFKSLEDRKNHVSSLFKPQLFREQAFSWSCWESLNCCWEGEWNPLAKVFVLLRTSCMFHAATHSLWLPAFLFLSYIPQVILVVKERKKKYSPVFCLLNPTQETSEMDIEGRVRL